MSYRFGVDVGGTFTDVVCLRDGQLFRGKADTTHYDLKVGFFNATRIAAERAGLNFEEALTGTDGIVYSTTVGTNALIERRGTKLGLITTKGFEDTVKVGRARNWADGLPIEKRYDRGRAVRPPPLIHPSLTVGVQERIDNLGNVIIPLRESDVLERVQYLVDQGVRGIVVVTLNSYVNPVHEREIARIIREHYPECYLGHLPVYTSSDISPKSGEYRRSMTVIIDAYLRDLSEGHLLRLNDDLRQAGYTKPLFVAKNTGGLSSLSRAQALHLLGSSPSATVIGADHVGKTIGSKNIIISDMGGTSFDVGLVVEGRDRVYELDPVIDRFRVQVPYVAHWSIGAGGGSIARVIEGQLKVGPDSAGSKPGPVCYDRGGTEPTVTDADLVLGYIDPDHFLGGKVKLRLDRASEVIRRKIADPLGISTVEAAWQIKRIIDGIMGQEMYRICSLTSGQDPRDFVLFSMGGAGAVHAAGYADGADIYRVATFPFSSVFGAFSTLALDIIQTYEKTFHVTFYDGDSRKYLDDRIGEFNDAVESLLAVARRDMEEEGFDFSDVELVVDLSLCYGQQRQTLPIRLKGYRLDDIGGVKALCEQFNTEYAAQFGEGAVFSSAGIELNDIRLSALGPVKKHKLTPIDKVPDPETARRGSRKAYWGEASGYVDTPVYDRDKLGAGVDLMGPLLCDADDTVIVVPPGWAYKTDTWGVGWIERVDTPASGKK
ncbi:MAG: hydantoinase/oxoprolinase family protein [Bradyrhizobiaceae bacterium]|nr:MAG: hydantoinase/oxoprolinase family protein [Bradyrhizobiaceae bacterium]